MKTIYVAALVAVGVGLFALYASGFFNRFISRDPATLPQYHLDAKSGPIPHGNITLPSSTYHDVDYLLPQWQPTHKPGIIPSFNITMPEYV